MLPSASRNYSVVHISFKGPVIPTITPGFLHKAYRDIARRKAALENSYWDFERLILLSSFSRTSGLFSQNPAMVTGIRNNLDL